MKWQLPDNYMLANNNTQDYLAATSHLQVPNDKWQLSFRYLIGGCQLSGSSY
jgi:hypothetical protein